MATYIKTLKEDNGDITYPQTKAGAVLLNNGSDLETELSQYVTAEDIASTSALTPPVQTNMIAGAAVTSDKIDWTTFHEPWQSITLSSNAKIGNTNYHTQNNRWRYLQGRQFIEIELNVGPENGSQVSAGTQFIFANISQAPFLKNGWTRIAGTGQNGVLGNFEFIKVSGQTNNIRYTPITGSTNYLACHEIIPNPSA